MKSSSRARLGLISFLGIMIVALVGVVGYKALENNSTPYDDNRQCFYQAFTDSCSLATIKTTEKTIEGDPIITSANVNRDSEECKVETLIDGSQDRFGNGRVHTYVCDELTQEGQRLMASNCRGGGNTTVVYI